MLSCHFPSFFFFQAEDGIRYHCVTGVQTCARPIYPDNVFDEKLTLRHSGDYGGEPQNLEFEWYYKPDNAGFVRTNLPLVLTNGNISDLRGWTPYQIGRASCREGEYTRAGTAMSKKE